MMQCAAACAGDIPWDNLRVSYSGYSPELGSDAWNTATRSGYPENNLIRILSFLGYPGISRGNLSRVIIVYWPRILSGYSLREFLFLTWDNLTQGTRDTSSSLTQGIRGYPGIPLVSSDFLKDILSRKLSILRSDRPQKTRRFFFNYPILLA